jgi:hypothetical protein
LTRIRIRGFVHWIRDSAPDPDLFFNGFQDAN